MSDIYICNKNKISWEDHGGLRETVKSLVKESRYRHILGVEREAVRMAEIFGRGGDAVFIKKLRSAALLHDITKELDMRAQLGICKEHNIKLSEDDKITVKPIHAKTGAHIAKTEFGADDMIFNGIYNHTIPDPARELGLFDKIIYLADWTEPGRDYPDCIAVREYFNSNIDLDKTILFSYNKLIEALLGDGLYIHKNTIKCRNALIIKEITV
jgi:nicotinate-nucleotide adenylyltransferase